MLSQATPLIAVDWQDPVVEWGYLLQGPPAMTSEGQTGILICFCFLTNCDH